MDVEKYISSGVLELYVAGALTAEENLEVQEYAKKYPEIRQEIAEIELAILKVTEAASPGLHKNSFQFLYKRLGSTAPLPSNTKKIWPTYLGWAASIVFAVGMLWMFLQNQKLKTAIEVTQQKRQTLEEQLYKAEQIITDNAAKETLFNQLRNKDVNVIALGGQKVAPASYAKAYWNKTQAKVFIDAKGLPEPPAGFTYQVWSLQLDPLVPTSIGLLKDFKNNGTAVFELDNPNESQAFGITLEPEGGSEAPNLEQLYTLGAVGP